MKRIVNLGTQKIEIDIPEDSNLFDENAPAILRDVKKTSMRYVDADMCEIPEIPRGTIKLPKKKDIPSVTLASLTIPKTVIASLLPCEEDGLLPCPEIAFDGCEEMDDDEFNSANEDNSIVVPMEITESPQKKNRLFYFGKLLIKPLFENKCCCDAEEEDGGKRDRIKIKFKYRWTLLTKLRLNIKPIIQKLEWVSDSSNGCASKYKLVMVKGTLVLDEDRDEYVFKELEREDVSGPKLSVEECIDDIPANDTLQIVTDVTLSGNSSDGWSLNVTTQSMQFCCGRYVGMGDPNTTNTPIGDDEGGSTTSGSGGWM